MIIIRTDKLYDGVKGIQVIPAFYKFEYIEWADRGQEGSTAPRNVYSADSDIMSKTNRGDDGKDRLLTDITLKRLRLTMLSFMRMQWHQKH